MIGTFASGSDFDIVMTLTDDAAAAIDLTSGTVTAFLERNGAIYVNDHAVTLTTPASGIVTLTITAAESALLPAGKYDILLKSVVAGGATRRHSETLTMTKGVNV